MEKVQKIAIRIFRVVTAAFAAAILVCCFVGCDDDGVSIRLLRSDISLIVGESRNVLPYVELTPAISDKSAIKLSTDSDGLKIDGTTVTAVKPCSAIIKVSGYNKSAELAVNVSHREVQALSISAENAVQTVASGNPKAVRLSAVFDEAAAPNSTAEWKVNGETLSGNIVDFTPPDYGEYSVTAEVDGVTASDTIKVFKQTDVKVEHSAKKTTDLFEPLTFTAYEKVNTLNPKSVYEWTVNGEVKSTSPILKFTPVKNGEYTVSLNVNGENKKIDGKDAFTFNAVKGTTPAASVEYDDLGGVYVRWAAGLDVLWVSITDGDGKRVTFDITDAAASHLFGDNSFRATEYIELCAVDHKQYDIALGLIGARFDFIFDCLEEKARGYLENNVLCKNSFVTDERAAREWVKELYATHKTSADCYVSCGAQNVIGAVREQARILGLTATVTADGNILSVAFEQYVNAPTNFASVTITTAYAYLPHIEYSAAGRRANDYVFSSDRASKSVSVSGTEQLLLAVLNGFKPTFVSGDIALSVYSAAKRIMLNIIGARYTPRQKVHAIYDWLQYVTVNTVISDPQSSVRFLESVFAVRRPPGSGYAVTSEGAAKAFALLCGIEGIPCTISCDAGSGRFYNKVELDGLWYNVDVYGGKVTGSELSSSTNVVTEFVSHVGLLISDDELALLGCTPKDEQKAFDTTASEYLQKHTFAKAYFDNFADIAEVDDYESVRIAVFYAFGNVVRGNTRIPYVGSELQIYNNTFGVEFAYPIDFTVEQKNALTGYITRAIDEYENSVLGLEFLSRNRRMITVGNVIIAVAVATSTGA